MATWSVAQAKAKLSEVLTKARDEGPQFISRNGRDAVVVVSAEEWEAKTRRRGSLAEFLLSSPLKGAHLDTDRLPDEPRDVGFGDESP